MSDETENQQVVENESSDEGQVTEKNTKVDMSPEIQAKFNKIYAEKKRSSEQNRLLQEHMMKLQETAAQLKQRLDSSEQRDVVDSLKSQLRSAREMGDDDQVEKIQEKITELLVEAKLDKKIAKVVPQQVTELQQASVELSASERNITTKWANEVDEDGELLRPWAVLDKHPKMADAADYLADLLQDSEYEDLTIKEKLAMVDEKFGKKSKVTRNINAVGEGSLTKNKESQQDKLSADEMNIALRLWSNLSKDKAIEMYKQGKKLAVK